MSLNTFTLNTLNLSFQLKEMQINKLNDLIDLYSPGSIIYPGVFIRELNISMQNAYELMGNLSKLGVLNQVIDVVCPYDNQSTGIFFDSILAALGHGDIDCPNCNARLDIKDASLIVFKLQGKFKVTNE